jgi:hypothetical protein
LEPGAWPVCHLVIGRAIEDIVCPSAYPDAIGETGWAAVDGGFIPVSISPTTSGASMSVTDPSTTDSASAMPYVTCASS